METPLSLSVDLEMTGNCCASSKFHVPNHLGAVQEVMVSNKRVIGALLVPGCQLLTFRIRKVRLASKLRVVNLTHAESA